jgi:hypothetical protein
MTTLADAVLKACATDPGLLYEIISNAGKYADDPDDFAERLRKAFTELDQEKAATIAVFSLAHTRMYKETYL